MANAETTFRKTLLQEVSALLVARELDEAHLQLEHVEEKRELLGELLDYYTPELLGYKPFTSEFSTAEIEKIKDFLSIVRDAFERRKKWTDVTAASAKLLALLDSCSGPTGCVGAKFHDSGGGDDK